MSITVQEIQEVRFSEAKKGYDTQEVDEFLERVATDVDMLNRALTEAASRIKAAERRAEESERKLEILASAPPPPPVVEAAPAREPAEPAISGEVIARAFIAAQKSADTLQEEARKEAERIYREAESKGRDIVRDALSEKQKTLDELARLRIACEKFRTEYLALLRHCEADAQKRLSNFDDVLQEKSAVESPAQVVTPSHSAVPDSKFVVIDKKEREKPIAMPDHFTTPAYRSRFSADDDLDIEEID